MIERKKRVYRTTKGKGALNMIQEHYIHAYKHQCAEINFRMLKITNVLFVKPHI